MAALASLLVDEYAKRYLPEDTARFAYLLSRLKKSMAGLLVLPAGRAAPVQLPPRGL